MDCFKEISIDKRKVPTQDRFWVYYTFGLVYSFFEQDLEKACLWFRLESPLFGSISARSLIENGRAEKVFKVVSAATNGEFP